MKISTDFRGSNVRVLKIENDTVYLDTDMRDSAGDWFYWAFAVEGASGTTLHFSFPKNRVGYYGPAVSHDLKSWHWLHETDGEDSFSYTFGEGEKTVYFAHHILYPESRIAELIALYPITKDVLCKGRLGSEVPLLTFGNGEKKILLTARHHACESTGSYVLEGVIRGLLEDPVLDATVYAVPFVDYDGYLNGDQGKSRIPYDHNRDYDASCDSIYPETAAIKRLAHRERIGYAFDFHSPWHKGGGHDLVMIVQKTNIDRLNKFAKIFEGAITEDSLRYESKNDLAPGVDWNNPNSPTFAKYMVDSVGAEIAFTLETAYFGESDNIVSAEKCIALGKSFAVAIKKYIED